MMILGVVGTKNSGKTAVAEFILRRLAKEGYRVGAVKHIHHEFTMDTEGKDTWRFSRAGAKIVVGISPGEIAVIKKLQTPVQSADDFLWMLEREGLDIVVLEGFREVIERAKDIPKVLTAKDAEELRTLLKQISPPILAVSGLVGASPRKIRLSKIPVIDLERKGDQLITLVRRAMRSA